MRTGAKALALLATASLALTACASGDDGETGDENTTAPITFTWGYEQEFSSYNANTADQYASANFVVLNQVLPGFWRFAPDGAIEPLPEYGTYEKTADDPLTVKYTFDDKAVWSDGEPIDCDDAVLTWLANSGLSGGKGFSAAGTDGYENMNKPQCADGDREFTVTFKVPFADWESNFGVGSIVPAHILEQKSGVADIIAAADDPDGADSLKAAEFYNTGWNFNPGQLEQSIIPASGPYQLAKWEAKQSITLEANPKWWGTPPKAKTIVIRYVAPTTMSQALQNGEINAMNPQPQVDLVQQLKALGDQINYSTHDTYTYEHVDFNMAKGNKFADRRLREAFTKCIPRQQIIDNLIKPLNPDVKILQSRLVFPFQPEYSEFENIGGEAYDQVDIAGAKALLQQAGQSNVEVRVGWRKDPEQLNKRRVDTIALIQESCKQAGFNVVDAGTPDFFENAVVNGNYDVALFAWIGSPLVTGSNAAFQTDPNEQPAQNYGKYSNPQVDAWIAELSQTVDEAKQVQLMKQIDTQIWKDLYTIPLFAHPGVLASSKNAEGVEFNATQAELTWNAEKWSLG